MTSNNAQPRSGWRSRVILIVAAAVVVGILAGLLVVNALRDKSLAGQATPSPATSTPVSVAPSSPPPPPMSPGSVAASSGSVPNSADPVTGNLADGCLGGANSFTAVLAAQKAATPDDLGAAAFARTVARWSAAYPSDPNAAAVLAKIQAPGTVFAQAALAKTKKADGDLQAQGYVSARVLPNLGQYRVITGVTGGSDDGAIVQVQLYRELTNTAGQTSQTKLTTELVLQLTDRLWTVIGSPPNPQTVSSSAIPWQSFSGAC
jgi:hypothetical protein